jgi:hypothetical protein
MVPPVYEPGVLSLSTALLDFHLFLTSFCALHGVGKRLLTNSTQKCKEIHVRVHYTPYYEHRENFRKFHYQYLSQNKIFFNIFAHLPAEAFLQCVLVLVILYLPYKQIIQNYYSSTGHKHSSLFT